MQFHSPPLATLKDGRVIQVLHKARERGQARFVGCSADADEAVYAVESGAFDTLQISVNIADQEAIDRVLPMAAARGMGVIVSGRLPTRRGERQTAAGRLVHAAVLGSAAGARLRFSRARGRRSGGDCAEVHARHGWCHYRNCRDDTA